MNKYTHTHTYTKSNHKPNLSSHRSLKWCCASDLSLLQANRRKAVCVIRFASITFVCFLQPNIIHFVCIKCPKKRSTHNTANELNLNTNEIAHTNWLSKWKLLRCWNRIKQKDYSLCIINGLRWKKEKETADEWGTHKKKNAKRNNENKASEKKKHKHNNSKSKNSDKSPPLFIINTTGFS